MPYLKKFKQKAVFVTKSTKTKTKKFGGPTKFVSSRDLCQPEYDQSYVTVILKFDHTNLSKSYSSLTPIDCNLLHHSLFVKFKRVVICVSREKLP